jgi:hypothetical protein
LQYPDFPKEFVLTTGASNRGLGVVLSQGPIGKDLPVAYASRSLNNAENHHTTSEKEKVKVQSGVPDESKRKEILYEFQDSPISSHRGMNKTYRAIRSHYNWLNMNREVEEYVKQCRSCQVNKILTPKHRASMEITTTAESPFEKCFLDVVGPLPATQGGNKYILTCQDDLSKYVVAVPIRRQDAETVAKAFAEKVVLTYGTPQIVQSDKGANFISEVFQNTCKIFGIKKIQSTAFHPKSQGSIERSHCVLAEYLRHYVAEDQTNWDQWIPFATYAYNTSEHSATGFTPFELLFGHPSILPSSLKGSPRAPI